MIFYYPKRFAPFWDMVVKMTQHRYSAESQDAVVLLGVYVHEDVQRYRDLHPSSKIIIYQLEPLCGVDYWWNRDVILKRLKQADEVWDYDYQNVVLLRLLGINARFRPFLYSDAVRYDNSNPTRDIDFLFFGVLTDRRADWLSMLATTMNTDKNIVILSNMFHPDLDQYANRAKIIINLHHTNNVNQQEQTRIGWLLCNGKHVLTEKSAINYYGSMVTEFTSREDMIEKAAVMIQEYDQSHEATISTQFAATTLEDFTNTARIQIQPSLTI